MKGKIFSLLAAFLLFGGLNAQEMTADELIASTIETMGGAEAMAELENMKMKALVSMGPMELPGIMYSARPNKQHMKINIQGKELTQAYDGETAWMINPFEGGDAPKKMPEEEAKELTEATFEAGYINYAEKGNKVELEGKETIEGTETYKLKLTKANGTVEYHYFDTELFIPIMQSAEIKSGPQKGQYSQTFFSDFQEVNGGMMPFFLETKMNGETFQKITIETIEANVDIEDSLFTMPDSGEVAPADGATAKPAAPTRPAVVDDAKTEAKKKGKKARAKKKAKK